MEAMKMILEERMRQIERGYTPKSDREHTSGELIGAAVAYAVTEVGRAQGAGPLVRDKMGRRLWPPSWNKNHRFNPDPTDPIANLTKAAALLIAEIERLQGEKK